MLNLVKQLSICFFFWSLKNGRKMSSVDAIAMNVVETSATYAIHMSVKIAVTPKDILQKVSDGADARLGETVERLLLLLRNHHTHNSWRHECWCEYCKFIRDNYTTEKLRLHQLKKRHNILDNICWANTHGEVATLLRLDLEMLETKSLLRSLKIQKKELQTNVI